MVFELASCEICSSQNTISAGYFYFNLFGKKNYIAKTTDNLSEIEIKKQTMVDGLWAERLKNLAKQQAAKRHRCYDDLDIRGKVFETDKEILKHYEAYKAHYKVDIGCLQSKDWQVRCGLAWERKRLHA